MMNKSAMRKQVQAEEATPVARHFVLIPAAGSGSRFGAKVPKQYLELGGGRTVLECTVAVFLAEPWISRVIVVVQADDPLVMRLPGLRHPKVLLVRRGGQTRRDTVLNGLTARAQRGMIEAHDWVHVHDAARPGIDSASLQRLAAYLEYEPCGALLCVPVTDTVKRIVAGADAADLPLRCTPEGAGSTPERDRRGRCHRGRGWPAAHGGRHAPQPEDHHTGRPDHAAHPAGHEACGRGVIALSSITFQVR